MLASQACAEQPSAQHAAALDVTECHVSPVFAPMDTLPRVERNYTNHLVRYTESMFMALGAPIILSGRVLDKNCVPVPNAEVILWQADANGKTAENAAKPHDFTYSGVAETGNTGHFYFYTIQPGKRHHMPPHINILVRVPGIATYQSAFFFASPTQDDILMNSFFEEVDAKGESEEKKKKSSKSMHMPKKHHSSAALHRWEHLKASQQEQLLLQPGWPQEDGKQASQLYFFDIVLNRAVPFKSY